MPRKLFTLFTVIALSAALVASAFAMSSAVDTRKDALIAQLDRQAQRLAWDAQTTKGIPRAERELQSLRVKRLIQRLQSGVVVDSQEIDKLLQEQPWSR